MKKIMIFTIIIFFVFVSFHPVITADEVKKTIDDDAIELTIEMVGFDQDRSYTKVVSVETFQQMKSAFEAFRIQLSNATTKAQGVVLFKRIINDLHEYGMFGDMDIEQVGRFVIGNYFYPISDALIDGSSQDKILRNAGNLFCLIVGETNNTYFESHLGCMAKKPACFLLALENYARMHNQSVLHNIILFLIAPFFGALFYSMIPSMYNPLPVFCNIGLGFRSEGIVESRIHPASGWITTIGLKGLKSWNDEFFGQLIKLPILLVLFDGGIFYPGVSGFTGIRISEVGSMDCYYIGTALHVRIGPEIPYEYYPFQWIYS